MYKFYRPGASCGFTLLEMIAVITLIGILATLVVINLDSHMNTACNMKTQSDLKTIKRSVDVFKITKGRYPVDLEELIHTPESGLEELPLDYWERPYIYELIDGRPVISCFGEDGVEGGEGMNQDYHEPKQK